MSSSSMSFAPNGNGKQKYTSKYFPPNNIIYSGPIDDTGMWGFLAGFAETQIKHRVREGILLIRLWFDAYDAVDLEQQTDPYQQYLMLVRKIAGRMIGEELSPEKAGTRPPFPKKAITAVAKANHDEGPSTRAQAQAQASKALVPNPNISMLSQRSTSLGMPSLANAEPHTTAFTSSQTRTEEKSRHAEPNSTTASVASFQERCKKLGLRVSSAKV
ncbi:hypothetical protein F4781DRAFT_304443 [Annulohypoxylon bovei var. microspora]|nr:hypothetical protein F4781DRAFT_304443 [Annulohypoxylon bovei var. microspora]